jgi:hypothetical protein
VRARREGHNRARRGYRELGIGGSTNNMNALRPFLPPHVPLPLLSALSAPAPHAGPVDTAHMIGGLHTSRPATEAERHAMRAHRRRQPASGPAGSARMTPRGAGTTASVAPSRSTSGSLMRVRASDRDGEPPYREWEDRAARWRRPFSQPPWPTRHRGEEHPGQDGNHEHSCTLPDQPLGEPP